MFIKVNKSQYLLCIVKYEKFPEETRMYIYASNENFLKVFLYRERA